MLAEFVNNLFLHHLLKFYVDLVILQVRICTCLNHPFLKIYLKLRQRRRFFSATTKFQQQPKLLL